MKGLQDSRLGLEIGNFRAGKDVKDNIVESLTLHMEKLMFQEVLVDDLISSDGSLWSDDPYTCFVVVGEGLLPVLLGFLAIVLDSLVLP